MKAELLDTKKLVAELCAKLRVEEKKTQDLTVQVGGSTKPTMDRMNTQLEDLRNDYRKEKALCKKMRQNNIQLQAELKEAVQKAATSKAHYEQMLTAAQQQMGRDQRLLLDKVKVMETLKKEQDDEIVALEKNIQDLVQQGDAKDLEYGNAEREFDAKVKTLESVIAKEKQECLKYKGLAESYREKYESSENERELREEQLKSITDVDKDRSDEVEKLLTMLKVMEEALIAEKRDTDIIRRDLENNKERQKHYLKLNRQMV